MVGRRVAVRGCPGEVDVADATHAPRKRVCRASWRRYAGKNTSGYALSMFRNSSKSIRPSEFLRAEPREAEIRAGRGQGQRGHGGREQVTATPTPGWSVSGAKSRARGGGGRKRTRRVAFEPVFRALATVPRSCPTESLPSPTSTQYHLVVDSRKKVSTYQPLLTCLGKNSREVVV